MDQRIEIQHFSVPICWLTFSGTFSRDYTNIESLRKRKRNENSPAATVFWKSIELFPCNTGDSPCGRAGPSCGWFSSMTRGIEQRLNFLISRLLRRTGRQLGFAVREFQHRTVHEIQDVSFDMEPMASATTFPPVSKTLTQRAIRLLWERRAFPSYAATQVRQRPHEQQILLPWRIEWMLVVQWWCEISEWRLSVGTTVWAWMQMEEREPSKDELERWGLSLGKYNIDPQKKWSVHKIWSTPIGGPSHCRINISVVREWDLEILDRSRVNAHVQFKIQEFPRKSSTSSSNSYWWSERKRIIILDLADEGLLAAISLGRHHFVHPTKCCTSFSLWWRFQRVIPFPKSGEIATLSEHVFIEKQETRTGVDIIWKF